MTGEEVVERLKRRFQLGSKPELRLALYHRLGQLVDDVGEPALYVITEVAADAAGRDKPGNYFAFVVMRRLIERRIIKVPDL